VQKINKRAEPGSLTTWKRRNPTGCYDDLSHVERIDIRHACSVEQYYLCAYCCQSIGQKDDDCMNEHVEARRIAPQRSLDFANIVVSCKTPRQCDAAHGSQPLPLTPLMDECETEFQFKISGRVEGLTDRAKEAIRVLNLGDHEMHNRALIEKRKQLSQVLLLANGVDPNQGVDDDELLKLVIADLLTPIDGKLAPFAPVAVSILKGWVSS